MNWTHFINNFIKHLHLADQKQNTNKKFNCVIVIILRQKIILQSQYFWDLRLRAIFSHLSFGKFWRYIFGEVAITQNYWRWLTNIYLSHLAPEVHELKVWVKYPPDTFQNVNKVQQQGGLISVSAESSKIHLLIKVWCIWFNFCKTISCSSILKMSSCIKLFNYHFLVSRS